MNRTKLLFAAVIIGVLSLASMTLYSQVSQGGIPPSFESHLSAERYDIQPFQKPDMEVLQQEDWENAQLGYPRPDRMGVSVMVGLNTENSGTWTTLPDGSRIWRLGISVPDALALGVYYDNFYLPEGGRLFLYNQSRTQVIGAFTKENNPESGLFATEFIQGEEVTLEYHEAAGMTEKAAISISEVAYAYKDIEFVYDGLNRGGAWPCMINVVCEEGDGWEDQIRGVARMSIKIGFYYYWCSGSLINNTSHNRIPYFLSAEHCGEGASTADRNQWVFYFNYQATTCGGTWGSSSNSVTGCQLKAKDPVSGFDGADWDLMQLNTTPPVSYNVFYNGWNRENVPGQHGVGIHHPAGDIKKISTYSNPLVSSTWWNGTASHWRVTWSPTVGGLSITQGGSSGSPIFDQDGHIMGDLSGGYESNSCSNPSPSWYGKVWWAWDQDGNTSSTRLKDWLDPTNTGETKIPGLNATILPPIVNFSADTTEIAQGDSVYFHNLTTGNPALSYLWVMPGAEPDTSYEENPGVLYTESGSFDVSLTVTNADGSSTELKTDYITVEEALLPDADFLADKTEILVGDSVSFTDLSTNNPSTWIWIFQGGDPPNSYVQNPQKIAYDTPGDFNVVMTAGNFAGTNTEVKIDYIIVSSGLAPETDFYADNTEIMIGDTVNFFDLSINGPSAWEWTFEGGTPATSNLQNPEEIIFETEGIYDITLVAVNSFGADTLVKEDYIVVGPVSVKDRNRDNLVLIYPNPTAGLANIRISQEIQFVKEISVFNTLGTLVMEIRPDGGRATLDLSSQPDGLYIIKVQLPDGIYSKKISLLK